MAQGLHINMHYWLLYGLPVWIVLRSIILFIKKLLKKQFKLKQEFIFNIFVLYIFVLIGITLFPIDIYWVKQIYYSKPSIQFIPILDIIKVARRIDSISSFKILSANLLGNILITVPIGIFPPILWKRKFTKLKSVTLLALLISLAIEVLQYLEGIIFPSLIPGYAILMT